MRASVQDSPDRARRTGSAGDTGAYGIVGHYRGRSAGEAQHGGPDVCPPSAILGGRDAKGLMRCPAAESGA